MIVHQPFVLPGEPTERQIEFFGIWYDQCEDVAVFDHVIHKHQVQAWLGCTPQASIALLGSLVRSGWLSSSGSPGEVAWKLTVLGRNNIEFFL